MCRSERISSCWKTELQAQLRTSVPATLGMLLYKVPWLLSLSFVGRIGSKELAAAALATTICNVTGMSLSVGLSSAVATLAGQARGRLLALGQSMRSSETGGRAASREDEDVDERIDDEKPILPLVYLYRGIFIQLAFVLPVGCTWLRGVAPALLYLGQGEELSAMTALYLRLLAPGLWAYSVNFTLTTWLQVMELAHVPAYAAFLGGVVHVPLNLLFIRVVGLGWLGVGVATTVNQVMQPLSMLAYLGLTKRGRSLLMESTGASGIGRSRLSFWPEAAAAVSSASGIRQYLSLALPSLVAISEWWASEICIFLAGRLGPDPDVALGAMAVYQSLNSSCFMFPVGMSAGGTARITSNLGSGDGKAARLSAGVCVAGAGAVSAALGCALYLSPHALFPSLFTPDANLVQMTSLVIPLLSIYVLGDGLQVGLNSIIKGCGRQCMLVPIILYAYWAVALPLAWYLAFVRSGGTTDCEGLSLCGVVGLVTGMTVGTWVHCVLLAAYCACTIDWRREVRLAQERLCLETKVHDCEIVNEITPLVRDNRLVKNTTIKAVDV